MKIGDLDRRVTFQRAVSSTNALNEDLPAGWDPTATVWASRQSISDGERNSGAQVGREATDRFTVRWRPDLAAVTGAEQLVCEGVVYDIERRKEIGRRQWLEFSATSRPDLEPNKTADGEAVAP